MGTVELLPTNSILIQSHIVTYGNAATQELTERIRYEIATMWNAAQGQMKWKGNLYTVQFSITAKWNPTLQPQDIFNNDNPQNNYFRIERFALGNISYVDAIGSNTGYFLLDNLYEGSTTAAHEYGHTIGLQHPTDIDYRGRGAPGIMYPRGTWVDPPFQYDASVPAGQKGGTMHPMHRKVRKEDIAMLQAQHLFLDENKWIVGNFTSVWHDEELLPNQ